MSRLDEQLTEQFRRWEMHGRGWRVFDQPVHPEPAFVPFYGHFLPDSPVIDDGRKSTFLSSLIQKLGKRISNEPVPPPLPVESEEEPEPLPLTRNPLIELQTSLPAKLDISPDIFFQFLRNLSLCGEPITFELLGIEKRVTAQFAASEDDAPSVHRQLLAFFPEAAFRKTTATLEGAWNKCEADESLVVEFGLAREFMFALASGRLDPFIGMVGALSELQANELGVFQVTFQPVRERWMESILRSVTDENDKPFFVNAPELTSAAEKKVARPLYAVVVRIAAKAESFERSLAIARDLTSSLSIFAEPHGNELIPLRNDDYGFEAHIDDLLRRQSRRTGMLLNSDELVGLVHLPSSAVRSPVFERDSGTTKAAPAVVRGQAGVLIGDNHHAGHESIPVYLTPDQRMRHTHIIGASGAGKSSLLLNLIRQDIESGAGVAVLDPHGDLIDQILAIIPEERVEDVVLVDPSDVEFPIGFNILQAHSEEEKGLLASDLVSVFRRLSTSWGDQMNTVLHNAILVFLDSAKEGGGGTLADLRRFLIEPPFRNEYLQTVEDPELVYYWQKVFPHLTGSKSIGPILTRLQEFFSRKPIRNMVSQRQNKLDFARIMDTGQIFLAKLSEGLCGAENSYLLGTLLVSKFQQLAMARQSQAAAERKPFWLYIDEFDHFITPSMAEILKGARKYRLGLTLAHQELHQLESDAKVASAVATHPCTRIVFRVGDDDAKKLSEGFESFDAKSLKTLDRFHAIVRVERNDYDFNLALRKPEAPSEENATGRRAQAIAASRAKYGTPRTEVESALRKDLNPTPIATPPAAKSPVSSLVTVPAPSPPVIHPPIPPQPSVAVVAETKAITVSERKEPVPPADLGRGGTHHQAIQKRIKEAAEVLGFRSIIEKEVLDGKGSVDLFLERADQSIACEISISTTIDHEVGNVEKCLKAGLQKVVVICLEEKRLAKIRAAVSDGLGAESAKRVEYFMPDPFIAYLRSLERPAPLPSAQEYAGYKVKRSTPELSPQERKQKEDIANRVLSEAIRQKPNRRTKET